MFIRLCAAMVSILLISANIRAAELGRAFLDSKDLQLIVNSESGQDAKAEMVEKKSEDKKDEKSDSHKKIVPFQINRLSTLIVQIKNTKNDEMPKGQYELKSFDARMPEHNHGMIVSPKITKIDNCHWKVEGFKLHMKGLWQFDMIVKIDEAEETAKFELTI